MIVAFPERFRYSGGKAKRGLLWPLDESYERLRKSGVWAGLNRLYEATVKLAETAKSHENRLDKVEVVQEWLARREREKREGL